METEITETVQTVEQENNDIAIIAKASIANIQANKKAYEELRDKYKGTISPDIKDDNFKATHKLLTQGSGALVKARTAATRLGKQETDKLDKVKVMIKSAVEDLIAITSDTEKEIKAEKERADQMIEDEKQEVLRKAEELKQGRIAKLFELGLTFNGSYYQIGDLNITPIQIVQYTPAQWEGFVSQATVEFEAVQLKLAEEQEERLRKELSEKEEQSKRDEATRKAQAELARENESKQRELDAAKKVQDEQNALIAQLQAQLKAQGPVKPVENTFVSPAEIEVVQHPKNGSVVHFTDDQRDSILHDVLVAEDAVKQDVIGMVTGCLYFTDEKPFVDTLIGKATLRIFVEQTLDAAQDGLTPEMVAASGAIGDELLFLVIKGK